MGLNRKAKDTPRDITYVNLKEGEEYDARLVYVADLGLHTNEYKGVVKPDVQKLALGFEILGETVGIDGEEQPRMLWAKPFNIYYSLTDKGAEMKWFKIFSPAAKEGEIADWESVLGYPVSITVEHTPDKKDPTIKYDNISAVVAIPKRYQKDIKQGLLQSGIGDPDDADNECTKALYGLTKWMYDQRMVEGSVAEGVKVDEPTFNPDDEIPF